MQNWSAKISGIRNDFGKYMSIAENIFDAGQDIYSNGRDTINKVSSVQLPNRNTFTDRQTTTQYKNNLFSLGEDILNSFEKTVSGLDTILSYFPISTATNSYPKNAKSKSSPKKSSDENKKSVFTTSEPTIKKDFLSDIKPRFDYKNYENKNSNSTNPVIENTTPDNEEFESKSEISNEQSAIKTPLASRFNSAYKVIPRKRWLRKINRPGKYASHNNFAKKNMFVNKTYNSIDDSIKNEKAISKKTENKTKNDYITLDMKIGNENYSSDKTSSNESILKKLTNSYKANIEYVVKNYSGIAKDVEEIASGKSQYNMNGIKKTAWRWNERFKLLNNYFDSVKKTGKNDEGLEAMLCTLNSNKYVRRKYSKQFSALKKKIIESRRSYNVKIM